VIRSKPCNGAASSLKPEERIALHFYSLLHCCSCRQPELVGVGPNPCKTQSKNVQNTQNSFETKDWKTELSMARTPMGIESRTAHYTKTVLLSHRPQWP
jgi:hypothetical protein